MIEIFDSEHGYLPAATKQKYGGRFPLLEQLLHGPASSVKIVYESGLPAFEELRAYVENEPIFVSFERLRGALVLRANKSQRLRIAILPYIHIQQISIQPIHHHRLLTTLQNGDTLRNFNIESKVVFRIKNHPPIHFYIPGRNDRAIIRFFRHERFREILLVQ